MTWRGHRSSRTWRGLSSSAALEVAAALALGFAGSERELAALCQRAENRATGLPSGILDQLTSACGRAGHALEPVPELEHEALGADGITDLLMVNMKANWIRFIIW
mgnify:CR=1 FL=1